MAYKRILVIVLVVLVTPIIANIIITCQNPIEWLKIAGDETDWIGFCGGYIGSILGAMVTLYVLKKQLGQNFDLSEDNRKTQLKILKQQQEVQKLNTLRDVAVKVLNVFNHDDFVLSVNKMFYNCYDTSKCHPDYSLSLQLLENMEYVYDSTRVIMQRVDEATAMINMQTLQEDSDLLQNLKSESAKYKQVAKDIHIVSNSIINKVGIVDISDILAKQDKISEELSKVLSDAPSEMTKLDELRYVIKSLEDRYKSVEGTKINISKAFTKFIKEEETRIDNITNE